MKDQFAVETSVITGFAWIAVGVLNQRALIIANFEASLAAATLGMTKSKLIDSNAVISECLLVMPASMQENVPVP